MDIPDGNQELTFAYAAGLEDGAGIFVEKGGKFCFHFSRVGTGLEAQISGEHVIGHEVVLLAFHKLFHIAAPHGQEETRIEMGRCIDGPEYAGDSEVMVAVKAAADMDHVMQGGGGAK